MSRSLPYSAACTCNSDLCISPSFFWPLAAFAGDTQELSLLHCHTPAPRAQAQSFFHQQLSLPHALRHCPRAQCNCLTSNRCREETEQLTYPQYKHGKRNTHNSVCGEKEEDRELVWTALAFRHWYICLSRKNKMDEMQLQQKQVCKKEHFFPLICNFLGKTLLIAYTCRQHRHPPHNSQYWSHPMRLALQDRTLHALKTIVQANEAIKSLQLEGAESQQPQTGESGSLALLLSQAGAAARLGSCHQWHCRCTAGSTAPSQPYSEKPTCS